MNIAERQRWADYWRRFDMHLRAGAPEPLVPDSPHASPTLANLARLVEVPELGLSWAVEQQPGGDFRTVTYARDRVTQFANAAAAGVTAFMQHGADDFCQLAKGHTVKVSYPDGERSFRVHDSYYMQTWPTGQDNAAASQYKYLDRWYPWESVRKSLFATPGTCAFATCIARDGVPDWGRVFVVAYPIP